MDTIKTAIQDAFMTGFRAAISHSLHALAQWADSVANDTESRSHYSALLDLSEACKKVARFH